MRFLDASQVLRMFLYMSGWRKMLQDSRIVGIVVLFFFLFFKKRWINQVFFLGRSYILQDELSSL